MDIEASIGLRLDGLSGEVRKLREHQEAFNVEVREWARGKKYMERLIPIQAPATSVTIPGPEQGWAWSLKICSGQLSANDSVTAWKGESAGGRLLGYSPPPGAAPAQAVFVITWGSNQGVLKDSQSLFLTTSGTGNITSVYLVWEQTPAERLGAL